jgi:hypothetical protein
MPGSSRSKVSGVNRADIAETLADLPGCRAGRRGAPGKLAPC